MTVDGGRQPSVLVVGDGLEAVATTLESRLSTSVAHERRLSSALDRLESGTVGCLVVGDVAGDEGLRRELLERVRAQATTCSVVRCVDGDAEAWLEDGSYQPAAVAVDATETLVDYVRERVDRHRQMRILRALQSATPRLFRASTADEIAETTVETASTVLEQPLTAVFAANGGTGQFDLVATTDERKGHGAVPEHLPFENSMAGVVFWEGRTIVFAETEDDPLADVENASFRLIDESDILGDPDHPMTASMIVPLGSYGVMSGVTPESGTISVDDCQFVEFLAEHAAAAFRRTEREYDLERANDRLGAFAAIVSHDLRNPLTVATGHLDLLADDCSSDHLEPIAESLERMDDLIDDVLTLVRSDVDEDDLEWVSVGVVAGRAWETVDTGQATLELESAAGLEPVEATPGALRELFENVFGNAVTHGGEGVTVRLGSLPGGGFYVEDDGIGVDVGEDDLEVLFEYGHSGTQNGTGLGLSIVRRIADAHGWTVEAGTSQHAESGFRLEFRTGSSAGDVDELDEPS
ncbi:histidine kinase dimerization/phospho-acceptor domain-containing protein [Saliphagus sp. GCM10025317]